MAQHAAHELEFGGPWGALGIVLALPLVIHALFFWCGARYCMNFGNLGEALAYLPTSLDQVWDPWALAVALAWMGALAVLERFLPCRVVEGMPLADKSRLQYRLNGHRSFWIALAALGALHWAGYINLKYCYTHYAQLATAAILISGVMSVLLYAVSFRKGAKLALGGDTGYPIYDFFIGRELNPRIGSFDWKYFCELRPGIIGWAVLNLSMLLAQYERQGSVSPSMALVVAFQGLYAWDSLWHEQAILSTMDITTDGFGFMLAFGDLAWVPFTYSLQARYLVDHDAGLHWAAIVLIAALNVLGYVTFRRSNSEKDAFRRNPEAPEVKHLRSMPTKRGTRLLVSGWWGLARKINYTGDWVMGLSWCLLCGFGSFIPYFYATYFFVLLVQRAWRDNKMCEEKYGEDWKKYTQQVPYIFIPYVI